jgi:hypothetical protein
MNHKEERELVKLVAEHDRCYKGGDYREAFKVAKRIFEKHGYKIRAEVGWKEPKLVKA